MTVGKEWTEQSIQLIIDGLKHKPGAMLPILHAIQNEIGYIPEKAVAQIAESLLQTRAEVHGVISFYHHFRTTPPGKHTIEFRFEPESWKIGGVVSLISSIILLLIILLVGYREYRSYKETA